MAYLKEHLTFDHAKIVVESIKEEAYLYKWTHLPTGKWYVGSRTAKGCHVQDGYICSSTTVKPMIKESPDDWTREILAIGSGLYIRDLEARYLVSLDAKNDVMSYNLHNGDGKFTTAGRSSTSRERKIVSERFKGKPRSLESIQKTAAGLRGQKRSPETCKRIGQASTGRVQSQLAREKNRISNTGEKNGMFGKSHSNESRTKMSINKTGKRTQKWSGYWVSPKGEKFEFLREASKVCPEISTNTLRIWCKNNKNGWSFEKAK